MNKLRKRQANIIGIASLLIVVVVFAMLLSGTWRVSGSTADEGLNAVQQAVERAAVLCYATEGFYPPDLDYIKTHYGVQVDSGKYIVMYQVFASNIRPVVNVHEVGAG